VAEPSSRAAGLAVAGSWLTLVVAIAPFLLVSLQQQTRNLQDDFEVFPVPDAQLRLIFTCCHPALSGKAQIALTLRMLGGLTSAEIARAFLVGEAAIAQRIARAKPKIARARIAYEVPNRECWAPRLDAVLSVLYLVFNEGYLATSHEHLVRGDLIADALRLARGLLALSPHEPEVMGLLALMLLHDSRRDARVSDEGDLVLLEEQDRGRWNRQQTTCWYRWKWTLGRREARSTL
jgi:RNA polymerase sigma-70 factor (ECF subfamily)